MNGIDGVILTGLACHPDVRGSFVEVGRASHGALSFTQINHSFSRAGVLRGLHFHQRQSDLWYVVSGRAQVALVDLRDCAAGPISRVFELSGEHPSTLLIPPGVAHGYLALTDVHLVYIVSEEYDGDDEHGVRWNDPALAIPWANEEPVLSDRDEANPELRWESIPSFS